MFQEEQLKMPEQLKTKPKIQTCLGEKRDKTEKKILCCEYDEKNPNGFLKCFNNYYYEYTYLNEAMKNCKTSNK